MLVVTTAPSRVASLSVWGVGKEVVASEPEHIRLGVGASAWDVCNHLDVCIVEKPFAISN